MDKEDVVHIYNAVLLSHKKEQTMLFAATWMVLEIVILSEVSQKQKDKYHMISLICCSVAKSCLTATPWTAAHQASLSFIISRSLLKFMSIELVMLSNHLILCLRLLLPSVFPRIRVFSNELALHIRWAKYWSFSISPMNIQGLFPLGLTGLLSLQSKGLSRVFSSTTVQKHPFFGAQFSL